MGGRKRIPVSEMESAGTLTIKERKEREATESNAETLRNELENPPAKLFVSRFARSEYFRILENLKKFPIIGNLDRENLILYVNAWSEYQDVVKSEKKASPIDDPEELLSFITAKEKATKQMFSAGGKIGLDMSSRLKAAEDITRRQTADVEDAFGDI